MDFHSLTRKELQALCKQNRIPANITNLAMADALEALLATRGTEGFVQETLENQSAKKSVASASAPLRFSRRTSTRRPAEAAAPSPVEPTEHPASPLPRARRVTTRTSDIRTLFSEDEQNQTKGEVSVESTPITSTVKSATRRTRKKEAVAKESRTIATSEGRRTTAWRGVETPGVVVQEIEDSRKEQNADANERGTVEGSKTTSRRQGRRMTARRGADAPVVGEQEKEHTDSSSKVSARRTRQSSKATAVDVTTTATRRSARARARASIPVMQALAPEAELLQKDVDIKDPGKRDTDSVSLSCDKSLDLGTVDVDKCGEKSRNLDADARINEQQLAIVVEEDGVDALKAEKFAEVKQLESLATDEELEKQDAECPKHQVDVEVEEDEIAAPTADAGAEELEILVQENEEVADVEEFKKMTQEKEEQLEKGGIAEFSVDVEDATATQEVEAGVEKLETLAQEKEELERGDITEFSVDEQDAIVTQEVESDVEELETLAHEKEELEKDEIVELAVGKEIVTQKVETGMEDLEILVQEEESEKVGIVEFEILVKKKDEKMEKGETVELTVNEEDAIATQEVEAGVKDLEILVQEEETEKGDIVELAVDEEDAIATQEQASEKGDNNKLALDEVAEFANVEELENVSTEKEAELGKRAIDKLENLVQQKGESEKGDIVELAVDEEEAIGTQEVEASVRESDILVQEKEEELEKGECNKLATDEVGEFANLTELENVPSEKGAELEKRDIDKLEFSVQEDEKGECNKLATDEVPEFANLTELENVPSKKEAELEKRDIDELEFSVQEEEKGESNKLARDEVAEFADVKELQNVPNEKEAELEKRDIDELEEEEEEDDDDDDDELEKGENNELSIDEVASPEAEQMDMAIATQQVSIGKEENGSDSLCPSCMSLDLARAEADVNCEQDCNLKINDDMIPQLKLATEVEEDELAGTEAEGFSELDIVTQEEEQMEKDGKSQEGNKEHNDYPGLQEESTVLRLITSLENLKIDDREDEEMRQDLFREGTIPSEPNNFGSVNQVSIDDNANEKLEKAMGSPAKITGEARDVNTISEVGKNEKSLYCEANKENEIGEVNVENDAKKQVVAINQMSLIKLKNLYKEKINMDNNKVEVRRSALSEIIDNEN